MLAERLIARMVAERAQRALQQASESPTQPLNNEVASTQEPSSESVESTLSATLVEIVETIMPPDPVDGLSLSHPPPADVATDNEDNGEQIPMLVDDSDDDSVTPRRKKKRKKNKYGPRSSPPLSTKSSHHPVAVEPALNDDSWIIDGLGSSKKTWTKSVFPAPPHHEPSPPLPANAASSPRLVSRLSMDVDVLLGQCSSSGAASEEGQQQLVDMLLNGDDGKSFKEMTPWDFQNQQRKMKRDAKAAATAAEKQVQSNEESPPRLAAAKKQKLGSPGSLSSKRPVFPLIPENMTEHRVKEEHNSPTPLSRAHSLPVAVSERDIPSSRKYCFESTDVPIRRKKLSDVDTKHKVFSLNLQDIEELGCATETCEFGGYCFADTPIAVVHQLRNDIWNVRQERAPTATERGAIIEAQIQDAWNPYTKCFTWTIPLDRCSSASREVCEAGYLKIYGHSTSSIASAAPRQWMNARKLRTDPDHVLTRESFLQEFATKTQAALDYIILQGELSADLSPGDFVCSRLKFHF